VINAYFYFSDTYIQVAANSFTKTLCGTAINNGNSPALIATSQSHYNNNGTPITYVQEYDITSRFNSITNFGFRNGDQMVLYLNYNTTYWGTINSCTVLGGVSSTSNTALATCNVGSNSNIYITNIAGFVTTPSLASSTNMRIKIKFVATPSTADVASTSIYFWMTLYANYDAYSQGYQGIFNDYNSLVTGSSSSTSQSSCYWQRTDYCTLMQTAS